jgi:hypothetical protein
MNTYQQYWIDKFEKVMSKEELDRAFEMACSGHTDESGIKVATGCHRQGSCIPNKCPIYREYKKWRGIIDTVRKPTVVYVDKPDPKKFIPRPIKERDYKIKPKVQCRQMCKIQITKMSKKEEYKNILGVLSQISEHVEGFRFKRAYNLCVKNNIDKLAETLGKFIENN